MSFKDKLKELLFDVPADKRGEFKEVFNSAMADVEIPNSDSDNTQKFIDATLSDGTPIMIEPAVEVNAAVTVAMDGEIVAVEDASHELADGTVIVTVGGVITEVIMPEGEIETEEEMNTEAPKAEAKEVPSPKTVIERTEVERKFSEMETATNAKIEELVNVNKDLKEKLEEATKDNNEKFNKVLEAVEVLMDFSTEKPAQAPKTAKGKVNTILGFKSALRNYKKA